MKNTHLKSSEIPRMVPTIPTLKQSHDYNPYHIDTIWLHSDSTDLLWMLAKEKPAHSLKSLGFNNLVAGNISFGDPKGIRTPECCLERAMS